jgi:thymidylate synthase (FAD)
MMKVKLLKYTDEPQKTAALAARTCYSEGVIDDIEQNLTPAKIETLLKQIISSGHHSVLEHVSFSFYAEGVSRALLAQITRHRIASFSVQSQRYVKFKDELPFITPSSIAKNPLLSKYQDLLKNAARLYKELADTGIPAEDARYILPNAAPTNIFFSMNARELRHFFAVRCCNRAQWEIRDLAVKMLDLAKNVAPVIFADAGPECLRGSCKESKPCGNPWKKGN